MRPTLLSIFLFTVIALHGQTILPPGTTVYQNLKSENFEDSLMIVRDYTNSGIAPCRLDVETYWTRSINLEIWMELRRIERKFDENDRISQFTTSTYNHGRGNWWISKKKIYTYEGDLLTKIEWYTSNGYSGADHSWIEYAYDNQQRLIQEEAYTFYSHISQVHPNSKTLYFYDSQGRSALDSIFNWSISFYLTNVLQRHYNSDGLLDSLVSLVSNSAQNSNTLTTYQYNTQGFQIGKINFFDDNGWSPVTLTEYVYDDEFERLLFEYSIYWNDQTNDWILSSRLKHGEFCTDEIVAEPAPDDQLLFRIYPNPGLQLHLLPLKDNRNINTITFTDIRGVVIFEDQFQWPHLEAVTRKSANVPSGFYFVTIASDKHRQDIKWIKVE